MKTPVTRRLPLIAASAVFFAAPVAADWEYRLAPLFLWGVSIDGAATIGDAEAPLDLDFKDHVLENLDAVFTVQFEARNNNWLLFAEYQHLSLKPEGSQGPLTIGVDFKNDMAEFGGGYAMMNTDETRLDVLFGLRWTEHRVSADGTVQGPLPPELGPGPIDIDISGGDDWIHPVLGFRVQQLLSDRVTFSLRADAGYAEATNKAFNIQGAVDFRFNKWGSVFVGYRHMQYDYDSGGSIEDRYAYDAKQRGPLLGLNIRW